MVTDGCFLPLTCLLGFGIAFWKSWELTLVLLALTPLMALAGAFLSYVSLLPLSLHLLTPSKYMMQSEQCVLGFITCITENHTILTLTKM